MQKIDANGIMNALTLPMFLWSFVSVVGAVDITLFQAIGCVGPALSCLNVAAGTCCYSTDSNTVEGSVGVTNAAEPEDCILTEFFSDESCTQQVGSGVGNCCTQSPDGDGNQYLAAHWQGICRRRLLLGELESKRPACEGHVRPNAVLFTEHGRKGNWYSRAPMRLSCSRTYGTSRMRRKWTGSDLKVLLTKRSKMGVARKLSCQRRRDSDPYLEIMQ